VAGVFCLFLFGTIKREVISRKVHNIAKKCIMHQDEIQKNWLVIVNPNAGSGKGQKDWKIIERLMEKYWIHYTAEFTQASKHAILLSQKGIEKGFRKILVVGGDGTMNEVVNGVFIQKTCPTTSIILGMITVGTGNDWGRLFGIPSSYEGAMQVIHACKTRLQDAGSVMYYNGIRQEKRFFINIAGLGFDAVVVSRTNRQKERGRKGKLLYFYNLLSSLLFYNHTHTSVEIDGNIIRDDVFTISIGIGKYSGGGMQQTPNAIPDDGLFDITIVKKIKKSDIIRNLKLLYNGNILKHPKIEGFTGKEIFIDSDPLIHVEADGESLGHSPIRFTIIPASINIVYNRYP
jgi:YegS/Rv2252/BmrU family lipid kinase